MKEMNENYEESKSLVIEGRNAVLEALRSGKPMDKLYVLDGCQDGPIRTIVREAKKHDVILQFVTKERLNQLSETGKHQGVIAHAAAYEYAQVEDMLELAKRSWRRSVHCSCWIILKIPIIWAQSFVQLIWREHTA